MNQTVVITGGTSGIGAVAAGRLAADGARIVLVARDRQRGEDMLRQLRALNPRAAHTAYYADLSLVDAMRRVADELAAREPVIDVLINNAGAVFMGRQMTAEGLAPSFALNHLAYFVLTLRLLPNLRAAGAARIVCTASRAHRYGRMDFDDLQRNGIAGYAQSKLANLLFMRALAQRLRGAALTVNALHPGFVATRFADNTPLLWRTLMRVRKAVHGMLPEQGAQTLLYLACDPRVAGHSGGYYVDCRPQPPAPQALDDTAAQRLWEFSVRLTGCDFTAGDFSGPDR